ncbi:helix-turn-helix domain-containing protein [Vibrio sp. 99-8-1]|uniref:helix-turn-helix domain-containing protein n=1 Tax=Vibrio sp. 99-8-1 TaxID=2607602 RepID=UPI0014936BA7|nr:helix-turn-helix domain-containing protein [Vibrio sp. 99-8-1]
MNLTDIEFMKYVQEHLSVSLSELEKHLDKNQSTIMRSLKKINELMGDYRFLTLKSNRVIYRGAYSGYEQFMHRLSFRNYRSNQSERVKLLVLHLTLSGELSKKTLYERLGISLSTLKNDNSELLALLDSYGLTATILHRKGTMVTGNELNLRVMLANIIFDCIELSEALKPSLHPAATPVNKEIASMFLDSNQGYISQALALYHRLSQQYGLKFSYNSKKYLIIYLCLSLKRASAGNNISEVHPNEMVNTLHFSLFDDEKENQAVNQIISTSTISRDVFNCYDELLTDATHSFIDKVCADLEENIFNRWELFCELYELLKVSLSRAVIGVNIIDKKTDNVIQPDDTLSGLVCTHTSLLERAAKTQISDAVRSNIVMIFKRFYLQNRMVDKKKVRVCVVSNSSQEKIMYFVEKLKLQYHIEYVRLVNSNEVFFLKDSDYDLLVTFTNKISNYLEKIGKPYIKLSFELSDADTAILNKLNLPRAARKININDFIDNIDSCSVDELKYHLRTHYPEHFI